MKAVTAIDSFKGCLTSKEANQAAAEGIRTTYPDAEVIQIPVSDGGEGFMEAFHAAIGGKLVEVTVRDPLMRPITARYLLNDETAVIEMAQASGLTLLTKDERNPMVATTYGTGQLVADAVRKGARHIIVGLGGSATSDAGMGMLRALIDNFAKHGSWDDITALKEVRFTIASDVKNPLCGENGAAHVFAPQKGATPDNVLALDERARKFAEVSAKHFGYDRSQMAGAGAAGGLGYAFLQYLDADCKPGIQLLLDTIHFNEIVKDADLIITGEGSADRQTLMGKLPMGILAQSAGVPVCLIAGRISDRDELLKAGFAYVKCINPDGITLEEAMRKEVAMQNIANTVAQKMNKVKITAIRQTVYPDLMAKYENPIEHTCDVKEGQQWISENGLCPEGMCPAAWSSMREFVEALARGEGNFYDGWMQNPMSAMISCNDGFRPFSFYIEVVKD